jgi:thioredoxin-dependent peroxiredoxin
MTIAEGAPAPAFDLPTDEGDNITLAGLKGKKVVLYFYPKDDTSGCTTQAQQFTAAADDFAKTGAVVVGVSRDTVKSHARFRAKHGLNVRLGADESGAVTEAYGVWVEKSMYGRQYMGIERATFLIDGAGVVRRVWRKVKVAGHVQAVLTATQEIN